MTITSLPVQSNVMLERTYGTYLDTVGGAAGVIPVGFLPSYIRVVNEVTFTQYEWYSDFPNGTTIKTVAAGTRTLDTADVAISVAQTPAQQTPPYTAAGYKPVIEKGTFNVTFGAAIVLANDKLTYSIEG